MAFIRRAVERRVRHRERRRKADPKRGRESWRSMRLVWLIGSGGGGESCCCGDGDGAGDGDDGVGVVDAGGGGVLLAPHGNQDEREEAAIDARIVYIRC